MIYYKNQTYYLELGVIDSKGDFVSGLTVTYKVYKSSDNSLFASGTMTEIDSTGIYKVSISFPNADQYRVEYYTPIRYENAIETIIVENVSLTNLDERIKRILGLSQENYRIFETVYDSNKNMTYGIVKIYPTATDVDNDTNEIAEYEVTATYNGENRMTG